MANKGSISVKKHFLWSCIVVPVRLLNKKICYIEPMCDDVGRFEAVFVTTVGVDLSKTLAL